MRMDQLAPFPGSRKARKRVGRGNGSGHGTYSGRGSKGQNSRSGGGVRPGFEGGQLPIIKRLPRKRGFTNIFRVEYSLVNVGDLACFEAGAEVTPETLRAMGLIKTLRRPVKVLGNGEIVLALNIKVDKCSASAKTKIEAAGGSIEEAKGALKTE